MIHVAILLKPYLQAILDGRKTIEMRLTLTNRAPFERVESGERIYLKQSGGPFRGTAVVDHLMFLADLRPRDIDRIRRDYDEWIGGTPEFWRAKRRARFCSLIWLRDVLPVRFGPRMSPHHGVAWQCLPDSEDLYPACLTLDHPISASGDGRMGRRGGEPMLVALTPANIRHGHIYLRGLADRFPPDALGGPVKAQAGRPIQLHFAGGRCVETDIVRKRNIFRTRAWRSWFVEQGAEAGDSVRLVAQGPRAYKVSLVRRRRSR